MEAMQVIDQLVKRLSGASTIIHLSSDLFASICTFLRSDPLFEQDEVQQLVSALCSFRQKPGRQLSTQVLIVMLAIFRRSTEGYATDRGLSTLIDVLNDEDQMATATQASFLTAASATGTLNSRKARVGKNVMSDMVQYFVGLQHSTRKRRQVGLLILELIHECGANQELLDKESTETKSLFFELLVNEKDDAIRVTAALIYRELQLSRIDLTGFCHARQADSAMPAAFREALRTASSDPTQTSARLAWAASFLEQVAPILGNGKQDTIPLLRGIFCQFDGESDELDLDASDGRALVIFGSGLTIMVYHNQDSIPYLVDIPADGIDEIRKGSRPRSRDQATVLTFKRGNASTIFIDGEGHRSHSLYVIDASSPSKLPFLLRRFKVAQQGQGRSSQALSPVNVSIEARHDVTDQRHVSRSRTPSKELSKPRTAGNSQTFVADDEATAQSNQQLPHSTARASDRNPHAKHGYEMHAFLNSSSRAASKPMPNASQVQAHPRELDEGEVGPHAHLTFEQAAKTARATNQESRSSVSVTDTVFDFPTSEDENSSNRPRDISTARSKQLVPTIDTANDKITTTVSKKAQKKAQNKSHAPHHKLKGGAVSNVTSRPTRSAKIEAMRKIRKTSITSDCEAENHSDHGSISPPPLQGREQAFGADIPIQQITPASLESHDDITVLESKGLDHSTSRKARMEPRRLPISKRNPHWGHMVEEIGDDHALSGTQVKASKEPVTQHGRRSGQPNQSASPEVAFTPKGRLAASLQPLGTDRVVKTRPRGLRASEKDVVDSDPKRRNQEIVVAEGPRTPQRPVTCGGVDASIPIQVQSEDEYSDFDDESEVEILVRSPDCADSCKADEVSHQQLNQTSFQSNVVGAKTSQHKTSNLRWELTDERLERKSSLIQLGASGPVNHGLRSEKKPWPQIMKHPDRMRGVASMDTRPSQTEGTLLNIDRDDEEDFIGPHGMVDLDGGWRTQDDLMPPFLALPAAQVTDMGSPTALGDTLQFVDMGCPWNEIVSNPRHADDMEAMLDRGRRISQCSIEASPKSYSHSQDHHVDANHREDKPAANLTPHEIEEDGYLNLRTDRMVKPTVMHNPFAEPRKIDPATSGSNAKEAPVSQGGVATRAQSSVQFQQPSHQTTGETLADRPIRKEVRFATVQRRASLVKSEATSTTAAQHRPVKKIAKTSPVTRDGGLILEGPSIADTKREHKKARNCRKMEREPPKELLVPQKRMEARSAAHHATSGQDGTRGSRKRPSAFVEVESAEERAATDPQAKRRKHRAHKSSHRGGSSSGSSSSGSSHSSDSSEDPDRTLVSPDDEDEIYISPETELRSAFTKLAETLMSSITSFEKVAVDFVDSFTTSAIQMVDAMLDSRAATESDFQNRTVKAKKRFHHELHSSSGNLIKAEHESKRQRGVGAEDNDKTWRDGINQVLLAERAWLEVFA